MSSSDLDVVPIHRFLASRRTQRRLISRRPLEKYVCGLGLIYSVCTCVVRAIL